MTTCVKCRILVAGALMLMTACPAAAGPVAVWRGDQMAGGGRERFGDRHFGEAVNFVYGRPAGDLSAMAYEFTPAGQPPPQAVLHLRARDDDQGSRCRIRITLNGQTIHDGPNPFAADRWETRRFPLPPGALQTGTNRLVIECTEDGGGPGRPPWFMVAAGMIGGPDDPWRPPLTADFFVSLPATTRPFPEPLPAGRDRPGFAIRGIKGWMWTPRQYLQEIPVLVRLRMNFLMNCYTSVCDVEHHPWGSPQCNRWWEPLPEAKKRGFEEVVAACRRAGIDFCFSMNPNLSSSRFVDPDRPEDVEALWRHYAWMQGLGVRWFNISLDDITQGIDAAAQARVVNEIFRRLRSADGQAEMIFCPTFYWGDGTEPQARSYLEILAASLHPEVRLFWTGDRVVGPVTRRAAESYRRIAGRRLILWDNYPVNDAQPTMHLGPVTGRDADLCEVVEGYMSNAMCTQIEINRVPLATCADYAWNPWAYDPARSIGQAILHLTETPAQRRALRDVVEAYPGMLLCGAGTGHNPVRAQFERLASAPHSRYVVEAYIDRFAGIVAAFAEAFPGRYEAERRTMNDDLAWLRRSLEDRYGPRDESCTQPDDTGGS